MSGHAPPGTWRCLAAPSNDHTRLPAGLHCSTNLLLLPQPMAGQTIDQVLKNQSLWMVVPRDMVSFDGAGCDKVGAGFAGFRYQISGCKRAPQVRARERWAAARRPWGMLAASSRVLVSRGHGGLVNMPARRAPGSRCMMVAQVATLAQLTHWLPSFPRAPTAPCRPA
jgi:hypothetical protein